MLLCALCMLSAAYARMFYVKITYYDLHMLPRHPSVDFSVVSANGKVYKAGDEVDLRDRDWAEYDAEHDQNIQVFNLDYRIEQNP
ncbi:DUF866 domain-containing protein [archaeon]|nr:MAG: DUF866 domain-containing protein [archaeon]